MSQTLTRLILVPALILLVSAAAQAAGIDRFVGTYSGTAEVTIGGEVQKRDMSTVIEPTEEGFVVTWASVSYRTDGRAKEKSYTIEFVPTDRDNIYGSAMKTNVFGKQVPLDPLKGEPFVWARLHGDTLTVYSLFINEIGEYEMQEYHRTLVDGGLELAFRRVHDGGAEREVRTFLKRDN